MTQLECPQVQNGRWRPFWWPSWLSDKNSEYDQESPYSNLGESLIKEIKFGKQFGNKLLLGRVYTSAN